MWHDMDPYDWLIKFYTCYMAVVVIINDGRGLRIETLHINQHNKDKLSLYKPLYSLFKQLYTSNKTEHFSYKGGCTMRRQTRIEAFKRKASLGYR